MVKKSPAPARVPSAVLMPDDDDANGTDLVAGAAVVPMTWTERSRQIGAHGVDAASGRDLFAATWRGTRQAVVLDDDELTRLAGYLQIVQVAAERDVILQDEPGDFMLVVLEGRLSIDRLDGSGTRIRYGFARAGDMLGDMALLDAGTRASTCTTRARCVLAVLEAQRLEAMVRDEPKLALALYAALSRRLSLRLRQVGARLSALLSPP